MGFASQDSDYDVRFIYARPVKEYLQIAPPRDVLEYPLQGNLDISGWDILKALRLFQVSNPPLLEWLYSPIIYQESGTFAQELRLLAQQQASPQKVCRHYWSMSHNHYKDTIKGKEAVRSKKYLYALRPIICLRYIEQTTTLPPTSLLEAVAQIELAIEIREEVHALITQKQGSTELGEQSPNTLFNAFIEAELSRLNDWIPQLPHKESNQTALNTLLWQHLNLL